MPELIVALWVASILTHGAIIVCYLGPGAAMYKRRLAPDTKVGMVAGMGTTLRCIALLFWHGLLLITLVATDEFPLSPVNTIIATCLLPVLIIANLLTLWSFRIDYLAHRSEL